MKKKKKKLLPIGLHWQRKKNKLKYRLLKKENINVLIKNKIKEL